MAHWSNVASGFDAEDETANFGARMVAEHDGSIYETWTRATIQCDQPELLRQSPRVRASFSHSMLCIAVDKSVTVFADESCQEVVASVGFEALVTAHCLSSGGELLFVAVEGGHVHGFNLTIRSQQVFVVDLQEQFGCDTVVLVTLEEDEDTVDLVVVAAAGKILRIRGIDGTVDEGINEACVKSAEVLCGTSRITAATEVVSEAREASVIALGEEIFLWPRRRSCPLKVLGFRYVKAQLFDSYPAMLCLGSDGCLSIVCRMTLLGRKVWDGAVADFVTVKEKTEDHHMLVLMRPRDGEETTALHLMSFPDFQVKFSMTVPRTTYLVELSGYVDHLIFLEGAQNTAGVVDTVRIKAIEESMPEFRLQRLLRRRQFEEAHKFAGTFHLNAEVVFHAEAMMLMERPIGSAGDVEVFVRTLEKIRDVRFVYDCCKNAMTRSYRDTRRLITYARHRIADHMNSPNYYTMLEDGRDVLSELLGSASDVLKKLETFETIYTDSRDESIDEWRRFSKADLLDECIKHLSVGELDAAALIWNRHTSSIAPRMNPETLSKILSSIPETLEPSKLWPWLRHFVPSVTSVVPSGLSDIIQWGYRKTRSLELHHRDAWPDVGLDFANGLVEMLQFEENNVFFQFHQQYANKNSQLHRLMMLVQAMSDLSELKHHYKVVLPLGTYMGDPTEVIHLLLNKVYVDGIPTLLESFLRQYMLNHGLQNDQVLALYVQKTLKKSKGWWIWDKAPWDRRLSVVIGHIHNVHARLQQTLEVLKKAPVPWSDAVTALAADSCSYEDPLVLQIRTESNSVAVKLILKKYGFAHVGLCSNLYQRIVRDNRATAVADLLELTKNDPVTRSSVLSNCVHSHLKRGDVDGAIGILQALDEDVRSTCCEQIVYVFQARLTAWADAQDDSLEHYVEVLGYIQRELNCDAVQTIPHLRAVYLLRKEFNIAIKMTDFFRSKREILKDYISSLVETGEFKDHGVLRRVERISDVLGFPRLMGVCVFFEETKKVDVVLNYVTDRVSRWEVLTAEESHYANRICEQLVLEGEDEPELAKALKLLCSRNLANCSKEDLPDVLQCSAKVDAYNEAVSQSLELQSKDWSLYPTYRDASISAGDVLVPYLNDLFAIYFYHKNDGQSATHSDEEIQGLLQSLSLRTRSIMNEHYDLAVVKILTSVHTSMCTLLPRYEDATLELRAVLTACVPVMLKKVVDSIVFDLQLGLACLLLLGEEPALRLLTACAQNYQSDQRRDRAVKELSYEYFRLTRNDERMQELRSSRLLHHWARRLAQCGIPYRDVLHSSLDERRSILCRVMAAKIPGTIELLRDFCRSAHFDFRLGDCCLKYLEILLTTWEPKCAADGVLVDTSDVKQLRAECHRAAAEVDDRAALLKLLTEAVTEPLVNFYHYEVYLIALELAEVSKVEWTSQLCFLQSYRRVAEPTDAETDAWLVWSQEAQLPPIAKYRLPFLPRVELFKLITPELTLKTYRRWLQIAPVLNISVGSICTLTVRNAVTEVLRSSNVGLSGPWSVHSRNSGLLRDIKSCLECMPVPERLEYGTASLYYVVNHTPPGADLVAAARECYLYMEEWKRTCPNANFPVGKFRRIREKYMKFTSEHILHTHGLGAERYLGLVDRPEELIVELYKDESIPQRFKSATRSRPDINSAVNALGELWSLNLSQIRSNLLGEWLQPETVEARQNDSVTAVFREDSSIAGDTFSTDNNLLKACYIVGSGDTDVFITYLVHVAFDEKEDYNPGVRYRALRVIQSLTDEVTLQSYTKINAEQFNQHMKSLQYLTELQRLGIGYSVNGFEACSKQKLAQVLVNSQYGAARALALVPQLFVDFDLDNFDLLDTALKRMVGLALVRELKRTLLMLNSVDRLVNCSGYISAWQLIIAEPFNRLDARPRPEAVAACTEALRLLPACPVVEKLQFREIVAACFLACQAPLAAALLPFLDGDERSAVLGRLVTDGAVDDVVSALEELAKSGILIARQSVMILERSRGAPPSES